MIWPHWYDPIDIPIVKKPAKNKQTGKPGNTISSVKALNKLQSQIASSILAESAEQFAQERIADKNRIPKSTASSIKKTLIKKTEVSCNGYISNGIATLSAVMGGTIVCKKPPEIDKFINARLKNMGINKPEKR